MLPEAEEVKGRLKRLIPLTQMEDQLMGVMDMVLTLQRMEQVGFDRAKANINPNLVY